MALVTTLLGIFSMTIQYLACLLLLTGLSIQAADTPAAGAPKTKESTEAFLARMAEWQKECLMIQDEAYGQVRDFEKKVDHVLGLHAWRTIGTTPEGRRQSAEETIDKIKADGKRALGGLSLALSVAKGLTGWAIERCTSEPDCASNPEQSEAIEHIKNIVQCGSDTLELAAKRVNECIAKAELSLKADIHVHKKP